MIVSFASDDCCIVRPNIARGVIRFAVTMKLISQDGLVNWLISTPDMVIWPRKRLMPVVIMPQ